MECGGGRAVGGRAGGGDFIFFPIVSFADAPGRTFAFSSAFGPRKPSPQSPGW
jgi:hypothetical protein